MECPIETHASLQLTLYHLVQILAGTIPVEPCPFFFASLTAPLVTFVMHKWAHEPVAQATKEVHLDFKERVFAGWRTPGDSKRFSYRWQNLPEARMWYENTWRILVAEPSCWCSQLERYRCHWQVRDTGQDVLPSRYVWVHAHCYYQIYWICMRVGSDSCSAAPRCSWFVAEVDMHCNPWIQMHVYTGEENEILQPKILLICLSSRVPGCYL